MASRRICTDKGFTLIETLIVVGLLAIIGGFTVAVNINDLRGSAFRDERSTLIIALQKARSAALNNINLAPHGVALSPSAHPGKYVVFEGDDYASADHALDEVLGGEYAVSFVPGSPTEVVFAQLSAEAECDGAPCSDAEPIRMEDPNRGMVFDILINAEGRVSW